MGQEKDAGEWDDNLDRAYLRTKHTIIDALEHLHFILRMASSLLYHQNQPQR
jgi:hypothetical protein